MAFRPRIPSHTSLPHNPWYLHTRQFRRPLQNIKSVPHAGMPSNMTMIGPHARIIGRELNDQVSVPPHHVYVAAERVRGVSDGVAVPVAAAFGEDELDRCQRSVDKAEYMAEG